MSNLSKYFMGEKKNVQVQGKNKENNLSFRNIAATTQQQNQSQIKINRVDTSFKSICDLSGSFYNSGEDLQQQLNYVGSCFNHSNKLAEYSQTISQKQYCKLCAAKLASLGYTLLKSQNFVSRDISPSLHLIRKKQICTVQRPLKQVSLQKNKHNLSINSNNNPVKFSTIISLKNKPDSLQSKYHESQKIVEEYLEIYAQKMDQIEDLINNIRIKDTQYINKLKSENCQLYEQGKENLQIQTENGGYDLFGKSLLKECSFNNMKFKLPSEQKIQRLTKILQTIQQISSSKQKIISYNKIPLIKSINSVESVNDTKKFLLKNSSSISNLSSKSNFRKDNKVSQNKQKFGSQINQTKFHKNEQQIVSSRFSSNSAIIRKKNYKSGNQIKTESTEIRRRNTEISLKDSSSCQDTPQSLKSKISSNSFVLPKNAAVEMFQKINVCESIDVTVQFQQNERKITDSKEQNNLKNGNLSKYTNLRRDTEQCKSSYAQTSQQKSVTSKGGRKSFNRYQNFNNQQ